MTIYSDDDDDRSLLHKAAGDRDLQALRRLLSQGTDPNLPDPREVRAVIKNASKVYPILISSGATLPDPRLEIQAREYLSGHCDYIALHRLAYIQRVRDEGGFANLARLHLNKLTETFAPKFAGRGLPPEIVRHVVSFWLHAGYYDEGTEADEAKYDSLVADITRKVAEMASLKGPRASVTAARLSAAFESDSEEDYNSD